MQKNLITDTVFVKLFTVSISLHGQQFTEEILLLANMDDSKPSDKSYLQLTILHEQLCLWQFASWVIFDML